MTNWAPPTRIAIGSICLIASFAMSVITWVALGDIAGYGVMRYVMPAVVDTYIACSLITWLTVNDTQVATLARRNTYGAAIFGVLTQAVYHCAIMWTGDTTHPAHSIWRAGLALICGGIPPAGAFAAAHMIIRAAHVTGYTASNGSGGADSHITQEVSAAGWSAAHDSSSPLGPPPTARVNAPGHATTNTSSTERPTTPETSTPEAPQDTTTSPQLTTPTMPSQTATPATSPTTEAASPPPAPAPATPARGSTAARGHSNTEWARGVTRPTQPRRGSVLSDEEWEQMDGWIDDGVRDFEIGKRMGRSEATVKKRRLERMARRAQRNGDERMVRR